MALPIIESPKYSVRLPSTGKNVEYRPFLVKEEKILLIAQESGEATDMIMAMKDVIRACTFDKLDPDLLTSYDLEFLFLKLRAKSVGETSTIKIQCSECKGYEEVDVNIDEIDMKEVSQEDRSVMLTDNVGITLRHIRVRDLASLTDTTKSQSDVVVDTVIASMEAIFDADSVHPVDSTPRAELIAFVNSLNRKQMEKIEKFIGDTPKIQLDVKFTCSNKACNHENHIVLTGVQSFFE